MTPRIECREVGGISGITRRHDSPIVFDDQAGGAAVASPKSVVSLPSESKVVSSAPEVVSLTSARACCDRQDPRAIRPRTIFPSAAIATTVGDVSATDKVDGLLAIGVKRIVQRAGCADPDHCMSLPLLPASTSCIGLDWPQRTASSELQ